VNPVAVQQADDQFYKRHPELVDAKTGNRRPLTMKPSDAALRREWMQIYKTADEADKKGLGICDVGGVIAPCAPPPAPAAPPPPPAPAPSPPPSCTVEVRAVKLSPLGYYHMFIVFTDGTGKQYYLRGGPGGAGPASRSGLSSELSGGSSESGSIKSSNSTSGSSDSSKSFDSSRSSGSSESDSSKSPSGSNPSTSSDSSGDGGSAGPYGFIATEYGEYKPGTIDWDPGAKATVVDSGPGACAKYDDLKKQFDEIAASKTRYNPLGPNSNSCVFTALTNVGITPKAPDDVWVPGNDTPINVK
jgi:hypothetical protein